MGGGVALLATGLALEAWLIAPDIIAFHDAGHAGDAARYDELESRIGTEKIVSASCYIAGGAVLLAGTTWLFIDLFGDDEPSSPSVTASVLPGGAAIQVSF